MKQLATVIPKSQAYYAMMFSVLPTFVFNEKDKIVGLRSIEIFRQLIKGLSHEPLVGRG